MRKVNLGQLSYLVLAVLLMWNTSASAQTASITLSESSAQLGYGFLVGGSNYGRTEVGVNFLYSDSNVYIAETSLLVFNEAGSKMPGLIMGLGGKLYGAASENRQYLALGVGGLLRFSVPQNKRMILGLDGYYAPSIVSFLDAERFYETAARVAYEVLPQASAYVEYRQFNVVTSGLDIALEKGFRAGMEINF